MAIIHGDTQIQFKLLNICSIDTGKVLQTILKTIEYITNSAVEARQILILSDFLSTIVGIQNQWKTTDIASKLQNIYFKALHNGKHILYVDP
jgi:pantothenate kinase